MTLLYTLAADKDNKWSYENNLLTNYGSLVCYHNTIDILKKYDEIIDIYEYNQIKHNNINKIIFNGDQTLSIHNINERKIYLDKFKDIELKYIALSSSIGDSDYKNNNEYYSYIINKFQEPLYLRETCDDIPIKQILSLDQCFWKDIDFYESIIEKYTHLNKNKFTFLYYPWSWDKIKTIECDVISKAYYDNRLKCDIVNPLNLSFGNWLYLIKNCQIFYTMSYHGFCFGVMFNKRIICPNIKCRRIQSTIKLLNIKIDEDGYIHNHNEILFNIQKERKKIFNYIDSIYNKKQIIFGK